MEVWILEHRTLSEEPCQHEECTVANVWSTRELALNFITSGKARVDGYDTGHFALYTEWVDGDDLPDTFELLDLQGKPWERCGSGWTCDEPEAQ